MRVRVSAPLPHRRDATSRKRTRGRRWRVGVLVILRGVIREFLEGSGGAEVEKRWKDGGGGGSARVFR